jgi:flavin reductase (DIM6/NTAB) family NADH-FMN oxidoreductase RutF
MATALDIPPIGANRAAVRTLVTTSDVYRDAMRELVGGVSVITAGTAPRRAGFTATSVASLSVDPPRLIVCANRVSSTFPEIERCRSFGVNILAWHHRELAARFSGRGGLKGEARFAGECWHQMATGASLLCDALVALDCELEELIERHLHAIVIGRVVATRRGRWVTRWRIGAATTTASRTRTLIARVPGGSQFCKVATSAAADAICQEGTALAAEARRDAERRVPAALRNRGS